LGLVTIFSSFSIIIGLNPYFNKGFSHLLVHFLVHVITAGGVVTLAEAGAEVAITVVPTPVKIKETIVAIFI
jgi:hypothetical protein